MRNWLSHRRLKPCPSDLSSNGEYLFAQRLLPSCDVMFDVGARTDDYFVQLSAQCDFHLFEPMRESCDVLREKIADNPRVKISNIALGSQAGEIVLYPDTQSIHKRPHSTTSPISVTVDRLDDYCVRNEVKSIDFLKIDVEGHELEVMRGGEQTIRNHVDILQFEYGGTFLEVGITLLEVFEFLGDGWHLYVIEPDGLRSIRAYSPKLEDFRYANYVASRRSLNAWLTPTSSVHRWFAAGFARQAS